MDLNLLLFKIVSYRIIILTRVPLVLTFWHWSSVLINRPIIYHSDLSELTQADRCIVALEFVLLALKIEGKGRKQMYRQKDTHTHTHSSLDMWPNISNRIFKVRALWWDFALWLVEGEDQDVGSLGCWVPTTSSFGGHDGLFPRETRRQAVRIRS